MPAKSKAQARKIRAAAARGEKWAIEWLRKYGDQKTRYLPERVTKKTRRKRRKRKRRR